MSKPCLRFIEAYPIDHEGGKLIVIRDPEELIAEPMAVSPALFFIATQLDGARDVGDVQVQLERQFQQIVPREQIEAVIRELDDHYLLDNERSRIRRDELQRDYLSLDLRPAAHAGVAYPAEADELIARFDGFFSHADGPPASRPAPARAPRGLVTPHIDFRCGGPTMAWAFNELKVDEPPELYIILGVAHQPTPNLYTLSEMDFDTPLGPARVNEKAIERLKEIYGAPRLQGEYAHKQEHSVEFQAVFLKYLHRDAHNFTILPILCGSFGEEVGKVDGSPRDRAEIGDFVEALGTVAHEFGPRVCIIAGVDLSHVGKKFGDTQGVDDLRADLVRSADLRMLDHVQSREPEAFFDHFRPDRNARNVDAVSAVYSMLHALGDGDAELLAYNQYREPETDSMVTFASMVLR